jgi:hypothetical protein
LKLNIYSFPEAVDGLLLDRTVGPKTDLPLSYVGQFWFLLNALNSPFLLFLLAIKRCHSKTFIAHEKQTES